MRAVLRINYHTYHPVNKEDKEEYQALWFTALGGMVYTTAVCGVAMIERKGFSGKLAIAQAVIYTAIDIP